MNLVEINDKTKIPLFAAVTTLPLLIISIFWLATVNSRVTAAETRTDRIVEKILRMEAKEDQMIERLTSIRESLARVEEHLKIKE